jgi:hypothetical protein
MTQNIVTVWLPPPHYDWMQYIAVLSDEQYVGQVKLSV